MASTTLIACTHEEPVSSRPTAWQSIILCANCCDDEDCETLHAAVFEGAEVLCSPPTCDECGEIIEGFKLLHTYRGDPPVCIHCDGPDPEDVDFYYDRDWYPSVNVKYHGGPLMDDAEKRLWEVIQLLHPDMRHSAIDDVVNEAAHDCFEMVHEMWWEDINTCLEENWGIGAMAYGRSGGHLVFTRYPQHNSRSQREALFDKSVIEDLTGLITRDYTDYMNDVNIYFEARREVKSHMEYVDEEMAYRMDEIIAERFVPMVDGDAGGADWLEVA